MKKYLSIALMTLAGLFAWSCQDDNIVAVYDPANVQVQGLGDIAGCELAEDGVDITTTYSFADFNLDVPVSYSLYADVAGGDFSAAKKVEATIADGTITIAQPKLNKLLGNLGAVSGEPFMVDFRLDAALLNNKGAAVDQTIQHSNVVTATFTTYEAEKVLEVVDVPGDYQGWKPDQYPKLFCYAYDGVTFRGVVDFGAEKKGGNGFKITYGGNWDSASGNWGSEAQAEEPEAASLKLINGDASQNIVCYSANRYYLFAFDKDQLTLTKVMAFDQVGVIGLNGDWDNDIVMEYNMYKGRFYADVDVPAATEFKFRLDGAWDVNWGGSYDALSGGGANLPLEAGQYRIYFYMNDVTVYAEADASMYGQDEPTVEVEPEPEPAYVGWGLIGDFNEWAADGAMTEQDGVWTGYVTLAEGQGFKLRKDAGWDENVGGVFTALGEPFEAVANGDNIAPGAGFFKVVYDTNAGTITISEGTVWSLIGDFNEWAGDVDMVLTDGKWVSPAVSLTGGWKLRLNHAWDENRGGVFEALDAPFAVTNGGENIDCGEGQFIVVYDPEAETITVSTAAKSWGVIGDFCSWGDDVDMTEVMPGIWVSPALELTGGWKIRYADGWELNLGGDTPSEVGVAVKAVPDGANIGLEGTFCVVYNANAGVIYALRWGIVGSIASIDGFSWNADVPMNLGTDGKWYSSPVALTVDDEFKLRENAAWDVNRGGACTAAEEAFAVENNGANIKAPADGTYIVIYDPATETITLSKTFWGLIGDFNELSGDAFMLCQGNGCWAAYGKTLTGGWKIRQSADWTVNCGGTFTDFGVAFEALQDGPNIDTNGETIDVVYDSAAGRITISK